MAMMDDKAFLISHIRNSFITSDETGMCELIIENEEQERFHSSGQEKRPTSWPGKGLPSRDGSMSDSGMDTDSELSHSYDILPDMDFSSHRRRSNTAQKLERMKKEKAKQSKIKHIKWRDVHHPVDELSEYFEKKEVPVSQVSRRVSGSLLSQQLEMFDSVSNNTFLEYAKFDGKTSTGMPSKKLQIFLTMAPAKDRPFPLTVITLVTAKVQELIGLICWQYTNENRHPPLKETVEAYSLHIAEDDGEVDMDFPALDNKEPISKFGFTKLALVEKEIPKTPPKSSVVVTINLPSRGFSKIPVDSDSVLLRDLFNKVLQRRKLRQLPGLEYRLEREDEPGVAVDLDNTIAAAGTCEFWLVRENSARGKDREEVYPAALSEMAESLSSHQYKCFMVRMAHRLQPNTDVQLGISGEKIEIDPVGVSKFFKQKANTHMIEDIAACTMCDYKAGRGTFRLVYHSDHDFRHHEFEADGEVAKEIVQKINNILDMRSSPIRQDYKAHKEKKLHKRHTFIL